MFSLTKTKHFYIFRFIVRFIYIYRFQLKLKFTFIEKLPLLVGFAASHSGHQSEGTLLTFLVSFLFLVRLPSESDPLLANLPTEGR